MINLMETESEERDCTLQVDFAYGTDSGTQSEQVNQSAIAIATR